MEKKFLLNIFIFLILFLIISCKSGHYKVDTSGINVNIEIKRLEVDLFTINPDDIPENVSSLRKKYRGFLQLFSNVINTGDVNDSVFSDFLVRFCTDRLNNEVYSSVMNVYPDLYEIEDKLSSAFRYYKFHFPDKDIPDVYTCITGFNNSIITGDSILGIGLDRYLGSDCEYYPRLGIYKYLSDRMTSSNVVPDCIYGWGYSEWDMSAIGYQADNVITEMIHYGKLKYYERCMLPDEPEEVIFGFTAGQMKFCRNNEEQMWQYLLEHDFLFSTDQFIIRKLTGEAPFTSYFTNESPGMAAVWLGFRIVESYMMKNSEVKLAELMKDTDIQGILEKARYSPK
ncbi:MAG: hypothetical protein A2X04_09235 [Bacteroidetes bacterium GWF2_41_9]|nr:MAG: hypothetical protein A2X03_02895 [Bacteroidetes bacterium GWA2_40_15]OFX95324.1 MAG: hypothetical protein A2X06_00560 [Bacteroidetes bacterium GWC2_40_22]OFY61322.1 MAG: hypothetical protein A2X04_09235 [Bacteroidetes bacterium GWF2_41_9]HAM10065.1 hypothetical protein [Bacteroidales bacterium]HBH85099.1 hypothetical protein [Bacteroidales bacterium]